MQLTTYITDLLYRYECVIIPGFGAFLTRYKSAYIDEETNTFHPPSKVVSFNRQLQTNDGLLANYIASVEKCSYELALGKIRKNTAKISNTLLQGERVSFENIGQFFLNEEKSLQFEPMSRHNFQEATFVIESPLPILNLKLSKQIGDYHIVAGAYKLEENADKRVDQLREKGFSPYKMESTRYGLHQVLYSSFEDRSSALKNLHEIRRTDNPDAWLLVQHID